MLGNAKIDITKTELVWPGKMATPGRSLAKDGTAFPIRPDTQGRRGKRFASKENHRVGDFPLDMEEWLC